MIDRYEDIDRSFRSLINMVLFKLDPLREERPGTYMFPSVQGIMFDSTSNFSTVKFRVKGEIVKSPLWEYDLSPPLVIPVDESSEDDYEELLGLLKLYQAIEFESGTAALSVAAGLLSVMGVEEGELCDYKI